MIASWLFIIILSYIFFGLFSFGDKLILSGPVNPKSYTFYVGMVNGLAVVLIPFVPFGLPDPVSLMWIVLDAFALLLGLYFMFLALAKFEVSRVNPTIGALQPIFIVVVTWILFDFQMITGKDFAAFVILIVGTFVIAKEKSLRVGHSYWELTLLSAFMFSLDYVFSKMVFVRQPFFQGLIWIRVFVALFALAFLLHPGFRRTVFHKPEKHLQKRNIVVFTLTQTSGALAGLLQSFAIAIAPPSYLGIMSSLRGVQYVFLFVVTLLFSWLLPRIFKEELSRKIILQKSFAILLIIIGLAILVV